MILNTRVPPIPRSRMVSRGPRLSLLPVHVLPIRPLGHSIVLPEEASPAQFGDEEVNDVLECAWFYGVCLLHISTYIFHMIVERGRTILNPSTSASLTHFSMISATFSGVPTAVAPRPPTVMCSPTVFFVHFGTSGVALDQPSTADLHRLLARFQVMVQGAHTGWHYFPQSAAPDPHRTCPSRYQSTHQTAQEHHQSSPDYGSI